MSAAAAADRLRTEAIELCRDLIRIDTSNPPGGETPAAEHLARYLAEAGAGRLEVELAGPDPTRLNLIARLPGSGTGPSLMLLGHTDVVPAPKAAVEGWSVPPFEGRIEDGHMIGRGAADMKGELASRAAALCAYARSGATPAGDVVLVAEADEERNFDELGITWLTRERPGIACDFALNEGGGNLYRLADGRLLVTVSIGEKLTGSARLRFRGQGGHASTPLETENPLAYATEAVQRLLARRAPRRPAAAVQRALEQIGVADLGDDELIAWARSQHPLLSPELDAMLRLTVTPTGINSFEPANVIPPYVDVTCDCRAVPGGGFEDVEKHVAEALGGGAAGAAIPYELTQLEALDGGTFSPAEGPLFELIEAYVAERLPGAILLPVVSSGFSDSAYIRTAFGTAAYGFAPVWATDAADYWAGIHSADEKLALDDLEQMARFALFAIEGVCS